MTPTTIELGRRATSGAIADLVRESRELIGWSQRELAARSKTSQTTICRLESDGTASIGLDVVERILEALGLRVSLSVNGRHLDDRRRQRDGVHARVNGFVARRLERWSWLTATEVRLGGDVPRGWIDLLAYREADRSLLIEETKTDLPDMGALQRSLGFYEREAWDAAQRLGWRPIRLSVLVVTLDSATVARRLADNRDLVGLAFPTRIADVVAWLEDPSRPAPRTWAIGCCDPASRVSAWLRPTMLGSRRRPPAYEDYADAARRLLRSPAAAVR
jgi:transcriptional regulator with XRE-family HTH domain